MYPSAPVCFPWDSHRFHLAAAPGGPLGQPRAAVRPASGASAGLLCQASGASASFAGRRSALVRCSVTPPVEIYFHEVGVTSALDLAGWWDTELEVRQSSREGWQEADLTSLLAAWHHARRTSRKEVRGRAAAVLGVLGRGWRRKPPHRGTSPPRACQRRRPLAVLGRLVWPSLRQCASKRARTPDRS